MILCGHDGSHSVYAHTCTPVHVSMHNKMGAPTGFTALPLVITHFHKRHTHTHTHMHTDTDKHTHRQTLPGHPPRTLFKEVLLALHSQVVEVFVWFGILVCGTMDVFCCEARRDIRRSAVNMKNKEKVHGRQMSVLFQDFDMYALTKICAYTR
jgi:hypothetical protein